MQRESLRRRSEKMVRTFILAQSVELLISDQVVRGSNPLYDTNRLRSSAFKELKDQVLNAQSGKGKAASKAIGDLTRAEMYGARSSQRRVLGMVAAVRREIPALATM